MRYSAPGPWRRLRIDQVMMRASVLVILEEVGDVALLTNDLRERQDPLG